MAEPFQGLIDLFGPYTQGFRCAQTAGLKFANAFGVISTPRALL